MKMIDSGPQKVKQNIPTKLGFHSHIYLAIYIKKISEENNITKKLYLMVIIFSACNVFIARY